MFSAGTGGLAEYRSLLLAEHDVLCGNAELWAYRCTLKLKLGAELQSQSQLRRQGEGGYLSLNHSQ